MGALAGLPSCIQTATEGYQWTPVNYGNSGAAVYRLDPQEGHSGSDRPLLYLKFGTGTIAQQIAAEAARLDWLKQYLPVPEIAFFHMAGCDAWLLTTAMAGQNAYDSLASDPGGRPAIVAALGDILHRLHALPVIACPYNNNHELRMIDARRNIDSG